MSILSPNFTWGFTLWQARVANLITISRSTVRRNKYNRNLPNQMGSNCSSLINCSTKVYKCFSACLSNGNRKDESTTPFSALICDCWCHLQALVELVFPHPEHSCQKVALEVQIFLMEHNVSQSHIYKYMSDAVVCFFFCYL